MAIVMTQGDQSNKALEVMLHIQNETIPLHEIFATLKFEGINCLSIL